MEQCARKRRRPALSCIECRRRKIRCNRNDPCSHCLSAKSQCFYTIDPQTRGNIDKSILQQQSGPHHEVAITARNVPADSLSRNVIETPSDQDLLTRQPQDSRLILNKSRILRWSHWEADDLSPVIACYAEASGNSKGTSYQSDEIRPVMDEITELLQKCKNAARRIKSGRPSRDISYPEFVPALPPREVSDIMVNLYLNHFESTHRILHVPTFWQEYQRCWENFGNAPLDLRLKILLVVAMGSRLAKHGNREGAFHTLLHQSVYAALTWLSGPSKKDRLDIMGIQIHCLTILARQMFSTGGELVWIDMGSLIHRSTQAGLHRDPKHLPEMTVLQAELRRRLWATVLEMAVQSSLDSSMPPKIKLDDFDTEAPSSNNDDEIDESNTVLQPHPKGTCTSTSIQLVLFESLPARIRILQLLNGLKADISYAEVLSLSSEVTNSYRACSNLKRQDQPSSMTQFHHNLLHFLVRRFIIPLHCPFYNKARKNQIFNYSLKTSLDAAMSIVSPVPDETFNHIMATGGSLFTEGVRLAATVVSLELIADLETQRLDGQTCRIYQQTENLKQVVKDLCLMSLERIQKGETNIKFHMFLSMILAQAQAIEEDTPYELKIAKSAKASLEICHDQLQTQIRDTSLSGSYNAGPDGYMLDLDSDMDLFFPNTNFG